MKQRLWNEQTQWMREDLEANQKADFRFVVGHHPPMTAVSYRQGDNLHMAALMPTTPATTSRCGVTKSGWPTTVATTAYRSSPAAAATRAVTIRIHQAARSTP